MTYPNPISQQNQSEGSQQSSNGSSLFGSPSSSQQPQQQQQPQQSSQEPASRQLIAEMASVHSSLKSLAKSHPEMSESVDKAIETLKSGMSKAISQMQTRGNEGNSPSYA